MTSFSIPASWTSSGGDRPTRRIPNDFYPTPPEATRALLSVESFDGDIWEPACGDGRISRVLRAYGYSVISTDLNDYGFGTSGLDFLKLCVPRARNIVTNPPYGNGLADAFISHALWMASETGGKVAMLLDLSSLCHPSRTWFWQSRPPARIYALDELICWDESRYGKPTFKPKCRYMWAVWTPEHRGPGSTLSWLSPSHFRYGKDTIRRH